MLQQEWEGQSAAALQQQVVPSSARVICVTTGRKSNDGGSQGGWVGGGRGGRGGQRIKSGCFLMTQLALWFGWFSGVFRSCVWVKVVLHLGHGGSSLQGHFGGQTSVRTHSSHSRFRALCSRLIISRVKFGESFHHAFVIYGLSSAVNFFWDVNSVMFLLLNEPVNSHSFGSRPRPQKNPVRFMRW